jgi:hemerythrin
MAFYEWGSEYSVGVLRMDMQHKKLIQFLNDLYEALQEGRGRDTLREVLNGLVLYTKTHFAEEEKIMQQYGFPGFEEHSKKHDGMTLKVLEIQKKFNAGEISNPIQITNFLKDWLKKHIMGTDKQYGVYLNQKGIR